MAFADHYNNLMLQYQEANPSVVMSGALIMEDPSNDLNDIYFKTMRVYEGMINQMRKASVIPDTDDDYKYSFMVAGFPRMLPSVSQIEAVLVYIDSAQGNWTVRLAFHFTGNSVILFTTTIIV